MVQRQTISTLETGTPTVFVPLETQRRWHCALRTCYAILVASGVALLIKAALTGWSNEYCLLIVCGGWGGFFLGFPKLQPSFTVTDDHRYRWSKIRLRWWILYGGGALLACAGRIWVGPEHWPGALEPDLIAAADGIVGLWLLLAQNGGKP